MASFQNLKMTPKFSLSPLKDMVALLQLLSCSLKEMEELHPSGLLERHVQHLSRDERERELVTYGNSREKAATWAETRASEKANCWESHARGDHKPS